MSMSPASQSGSFVVGDDDSEDVMPFPIQWQEEEERNKREEREKAPDSVMRVIRAQVT